MSAETLTAEFSLSQSLRTDRRGPVRWIISYAVRYWYLVVILIIGAISNAGFAAAVPVLTGQAFNNILSNLPKRIHC